MNEVAGRSAVLFKKRLQDRLIFKICLIFNKEHVLQVTPANDTLRNDVHENKEIICGFQKLILSTNIMATQNGMYIGGKRLCSILSDFYFNGKESNLI